FWQWVRTFLFNGIARCKDLKGNRQRMTRPRSGHVMFLHRLQEGRLSLRRRPIDLIGQYHVCKDGSFEKLSLVRAATVSFNLCEHVRASDVRRKEIRSELNPTKGKVQTRGKTGDEQCLGQAGNANKQRMPGGQNRDQQLIDNDL